MPLDALKAILATPLQASKPIAWSEIEGALGTRIPEDYKNFISTYGSGKVDNFLAIYGPNAPSKFVDIVFASRSNSMNELHNLDPKTYPFSSHPSAGGLLQFGATDNGDRMYWRTSGTPCKWTVVVYESRGPKHFEFEGTMTEFVTRLLLKEVRVEFFPQDFPDSATVFVPF